MPAPEAAKAICWLGESCGFWVQTAAIVASAIAAITLLYITSKQARTRALIDLILHQRIDTALTESASIVFSLDRGQRDLKIFAVAPPDSTERKAIIRVLNNQEFIAAGIRMRAFDEDVYKQMQHSNVVRLWKATEGFIIEFRKVQKNDTLFQDFYQLGRRWSKSPLERLDI